RAGSHTVWRAVGGLCDRHLARTPGGVSRAARRRSSAAAERVEFSRQHLWLQDAWRGIHPVRQCRRIVERAISAAGSPCTGPILSSDQAPHLDVLWPRTRSARRLSASLLSDSQRCGLLGSAGGLSSRRVRL